MAKVGDNIVTTGLSGKLGNLIVFRNRGGSTIVAKAPKKKVTEWSEAQEQHRLRFQEAVLYAKSIIATNESLEEDKIIILVSDISGKPYRTGKM